jgi:phospholipid-binding lipoprotein MlaA
LSRNKTFLKNVVVAIIATMILANCASVPTLDQEAVLEAKKINDPIEPTNRFIFDFNQTLDAAVFKPITGLYRGVIPSFIRTGVHNFLDNVKTPVVLANDLLQGEPKRAGNTIMRFVINSSVGIGGLRDQASEWGFDDHDEDFGQTLAVWGVGEGPYLVLPILGPSNPRDAIGKVVDSLIDPISWWADNDDREWVPITRTLVSGLDTRDRLWDILNDLEKSSIDYYAAIRSLYRQRRNEDISNGSATKNNKTPNLAESIDTNNSLGKPKNSTPGL